MPYASLEDRRKCAKRWYERNKKDNLWKHRHPRNYKKSCRAYYERNKEKLRADKREYSRKTRHLRKEYQAVWMREWNRKHPILARRKKRKWREKNREYYLAQRRDYRRRNADKFREDAKKFSRNRGPAARDRIRKLSNARNKKAYKKDPTKFIARTRKRKLKLKNNGSHTHEEWLKVLRRERWKCAHCGKRLNKKTVTRDHIIPLSMGGSDFISNIRPSCRSCNTRHYMLNYASYRRKY